MRVGEQESRHRGREHHNRIDPTSAVLVGPNAEENANERTGEDRRANQETELRLVQPELLFNLHTNDGEDRPDREADRECDGRHPERAALAFDARIRLI